MESLMEEDKMNKTYAIIKQNSVRIGDRKWYERSEFGVFQRDGVTQIHSAVILDSIEGQVQNLQCVVLYQESSQVSCAIPRYSVTIEIKM